MGAAAQRLGASSPEAASARYAPAYRALQEGRAQDATDLLASLLAANPSDGFAHQLLCRVFYAQDLAGDAIRECQSGVSSSGANPQMASETYLWLGRSYGMKARHANPISAFALARKVQASFARAVELNPANVAALNDLGEYDVDAPLIVGGGTDKARALAANMMTRFPGSAHLLLARLAVSNDDLGGAESEFKQVIALQRTAGSWIDLAHFYQTHHRPDDAVAAVKSGLALDAEHGPVLVDAASVLIAAHREPLLAEHCLKQYLASRALSDSAPAFKVHLQLGKLLAARGETDENSRHIDAAMSLAPRFTQNPRAAQGL